MGDFVGGVHWQVDGGGIRCAIVGLNGQWNGALARCTSLMSDPIVLEWMMPLSWSRAAARRRGNGSGATVLIVFDCREETGR